ncbi:probable magnesium transporter NIPA6, partial [Morus notabilis]|uniref:probable magnesium transporter NIPA6 n=1 Tax=Morus notabilis TaxID=981085 RepID=UPI000CED5ADA
FKGFILALMSSGFIRASFIIKKKGLGRAAVVDQLFVDYGGHAFLLEPLWWLGLITVIVGEIPNFTAYAFSPVVLVTPLRALSIIFSAVLAHFTLKEMLPKLGVLGCVMCIAGSVKIVIHVPLEHLITSVRKVWDQPSWLYVGSIIVLVFILVLHFAPQCGHTIVLVFTGMFSLMDSKAHLLQILCHLVEDFASTWL